MGKHQGHIVYRNTEGKQVPGVTTICGQLAKPFLAPAANKLGLSGINSTDYWKSLADIGSLAHEMILAHIRGEELNTDDYTKKEIDLANSCFQSYLNWESKHTIEPMLSERPLVSHTYQFGGTLDCFCKLDGVDTLLDWKTGGIYKEAVIQVSAYQQLLLEKGYLARHAIIVGIPRSPDESYKEITVTEFELGWEIFYHLLKLYQLIKRLKL